MIGNILPDTAWEKARRGKLTSSEISVILGEGKSGEALSKGAKTYIHSKIAELLTGTIRIMELHSTDWGNTYEGEAVSELKKLYPELEYFGNENKQFFKLGEFSGGSPDGVCKKIVAEVKCPENPTNHIEFLLIEDEAELKKRNKDYWCQIQMNMMAVAKARKLKFKDMKGIFVSFCPIMLHPHNKMKIIDIKPDLEFEAHLMERIQISENYMADVVKKLLPSKLLVYPKEEKTVIVSNETTKTHVLGEEQTIAIGTEFVKSLPPITSKEARNKAKKKLDEFKEIKNKTNEIIE